MISKAALCFSLLLMLNPIESHADEARLLQEVRWEEIAAGNLPPQTEVVPVRGGMRALKITGNGPTRLTAATLNHPETDLSFVNIAGETSYQKVEGHGFLEMIVTLADGSSYFSRTLAAKGEMQSLSGDSYWRPFRLPFQLNGARPVRIDFNVVLPQGGTVYLSDLKFFQSSTLNALSSKEKLGIRLGSYGGALFGVLGALIGVLTSMGKRRRLVFMLLRFMIAAGILMLAAGAAAASASQPYAVYYPLLLLGALLVLLAGFNYGPIKRRYEAIELRRMAAKDS